MKTFHFYMDDSGTRHPDVTSNAQASQFDWFALGGVIVEEGQEAGLKESINAFKNRWNVEAPLHSHPIRMKKKDFAWLKFDAERANQFLSELSALLVEAPVIGHACVIDRPSYDRRYLAQYGKNRWSLCKTTFNIAVERAAKFAHGQGGRLRVYVERSSKPDEQMLKAYYDSLRGQGNPFDVQRSAAYGPLEVDVLNKVLYEFRVKDKTSLIMQLADLYLYAICRGGYEKDYRPYAELCEQKKLIDQHLEAELVPLLGIKYSCFDRSNQLVAAA